MFHLVSPSSAKEKDAHADLQKPLFVASRVKEFKTQKPLSMAASLKS